MRRQGLAGVIVRQLLGARVVGDGSSGFLRFSGVAIFWALFPGTNTRDARGGQAGFQGSLPPRFWAGLFSGLNEIRATNPDKTANSPTVGLAARFRSSFYCGRRSATNPRHDAGRKHPGRRVIGDRGSPAGLPVRANRPGRRYAVFALLGRAGR